jgi:hypothetical protein
MRRSSKSSRKRRPTQPPIAERQHWTKIMSIFARKLRAGDALVVKEGRIRRFYHICEVGVNRQGVEIVYNKPKSQGGVERIARERNAVVEIRRTFHD